MRKKEEFKLFLKRQRLIAVDDRIKKLAKAESILLDDAYDIVSDDNEMFLALKILKKFGDHKGNMQNALRKYYEFINGKTFPELKDYSPTRIDFHIFSYKYLSVNEFNVILKDVNKCILEVLNSDAICCERKFRNKDIKLESIKEGSFFVTVILPAIISSVLSVFIEILIKQLINAFVKRKKKSIIATKEDKTIEIEIF